VYFITKLKEELCFMCEVRIQLDTTVCDKVCQRLVVFFQVSSTNKTDHHNITEILLKVAISTTTLIITLSVFMYYLLTLI